MDRNYCDYLLILQYYESRLEFSKRKINLFTQFNENESFMLLVNKKNATDLWKRNPVGFIHLANHWMQLIISLYKMDTVPTSCSKTLLCHEALQTIPLSRQCDSSTHTCHYRRTPSEFGRQNDRYNRCCTIHPFHRVDWRNFSEGMPSNLLITIYF